MYKCCPSFRFWPNRLRDLHEHAVLQTHDDLLAGDRPVVALLSLVAEERAAQRPGDHGHVPTGSSCYQAADP
jgi:hypothetical protein